MCHGRFQICTLLGFFVFGIVGFAEIVKASTFDPDDIETERIVGGRSAYDGQFPWTVALFFQGEFICTASLIAKDTVLTAAHCVQIDDSKRQANEFYGTVGSVNRSSSTATRLIFSSVVVHPEYDNDNLQNDIAFFKLANPVQVSDKIQTICLAKPDTPLDAYTNGIAMGWGRTSRITDTSSDILQFSIQKIFTHILCQLRYPDAVVPSKQLCGDGLGTGICKGDSGGPLVNTQKDAGAVQIGVASFVRSIPGCGSIIVAPGVFIRTAAYVDWIRQNGVEICVL